MRHWQLCPEGSRNDVPGQLTATTLQTPPTPRGARVVYRNTPLSPQGCVRLNAILAAYFMRFPPCAWGSHLRTLKLRWRGFLTQLGRTHPNLRVGTEAGGRGRTLSRTGGTGGTGGRLRIVVASLHIVHVCSR